MADIREIKTLQNILKKLDPEKPAGQGQSGRTEHQERDGDFHRRLSLEAANQDSKTRMLVTGQIGVGKSSELWHFYRRRFAGMSRTGFWVHSDLEKGEHPERCGGTGVLLTILRDCWGATRSLQPKLRNVSHDVQRRFNDIRSEILEAMIDWLKARKSSSGDSAVFKFGGMDFNVSLKDQDSALGLILGKAAQHEAVSLRSERSGLAPDRLVNIMNHLFKWLSRLHSSIPPLVILDHVDKIRDETSAREVLVELIPIWKKVEASVIMTAPFEYTLGEMRHSVEAYWGKPMMIYPLELPELDAIELPPFYKQICVSSRLDNFISNDSLRVLAHYSGGIPRTFVQFLIQALKEAHLSGHNKIMMSDVQAVVFSAQTAYQDYSPEQLELLSQIGKNEVGLGAASVLLRSPIGLLVMPPSDGRQPLRIHPLAESVLQNYMRRKKDK